MRWPVSAAATGCRSKGLAGDARTPKPEEEAGTHTEKGGAMTHEDRVGHDGGEPSVERIKGMEWRKCTS